MSDHYKVDHDYKANIREGSFKGESGSHTEEGSAITAALERSSRTGKDTFVWKLVAKITFDEPVVKRADEEETT